MGMPQVLAFQAEVGHLKPVRQIYVAVGNNVGLCKRVGYGVQTIVW